MHAKRSNVPSAPRIISAKELVQIIELVTTAGLLIRVCGGTLQIGRHNPTQGVIYWINATGAGVEEVRAWLAK